jgi:ABC-type dipeptide/oligopeptide/nickel transport system ATPase subunit
MLNTGPQEGGRHKTLLRIASHFKRHGIPSDYAKQASLHWNDNNMEPNKVIEVVESTYNNNYRYGCQDEVMRKFCRSNCIFFKRKDYLVDVKNAIELQEAYRSRMKANFDNRKIHLTKMLGLDESNTDVDIYPGELVTIFGATGSNKTTFAQNIALCYDTVNDCIQRDWQIPTLFLSLELSDWYMHRRNLQVVSDKSKQEVNENYEELFQKHEADLSHLTVQTIAPTIQNIQEKVKELQPACVIVDYIDLIDVPKYKSEYEAVKLISHSLSNMAVNEDIIIIQISQVSREIGRADRTMDLHSGKGSGAIENASRKVIGIEGSNTSLTKRVKLFKNTDGELFTKDLCWTPSFRMKKGVVE